MGSSAYLAWSGGGIPALSQSGTTGTGTGAALDDVPGWAECRIACIVPGASPRITWIGNDREIVYNVMPLSIKPGLWVVVVRLRPGEWVVPNIGQNFDTCATAGSSGGGATGIIGSALSSSASTGTGPDSGGGFT